VPTDAFLGFHPENIVSPPRVHGHLLTPDHKFQYSHDKDDQAAQNALKADDDTASAVVRMYELSWIY